MTDGVRLAARLWLPVSADHTPFPALLEFIPYRKRDLTRLRDERNHAVFAEAGYASIRVDMRGSGDSEGHMADMFTDAELDDAIRVIEWIAAQPWCDGHVGMFGQSWGGTASLLAACRAPPALKAIIACCATHNRFDDDIHHMGGCLLTDTIEWGAQLPAILASPPDPQTVGEGWRDLWMERLARLTFPLEKWISHEWRDDYWRRSSVTGTMHTISCPVLAVGGWADRYSNAVLSLVAGTGRDCWGIVGPWGHHYPFAGEPGPAMGFQQEAVRWWDHWLKGVDNGIDREPRLRIWRMEYQPPADRMAERRGDWIAEDSWPTSRIAPLVFALADGKLTGPPGGDSQTVAVPHDARVGLAGGDTGYFGRTGGLPLDQCADDALSLVFESDRLETPLDLLGETVLDLEVTCDAPVATLALRLNDVPPEGGVARVVCAVRNLALDDEGVPFGTPERRRRCRIVFPGTAYRFRAGHRIRLALSASLWPQIWPSPDSAPVTIDAGKARLTLPQRTGDRKADASVRFPPPLEPDGESATTLAAPSISRDIGRDAASGRLTSGWTNTPARVRFCATGVTFGSRTRCDHSIVPGDNNSGHSRVEHRLTFHRDDWFVTVTSIAELRSTPTMFLPRGRLEVTENGDTVLVRTWSSDIPRTCS